MHQINMDLILLVTIMAKICCVHVATILASEKCHTSALFMGISFLLRYYDHEDHNYDYCNSSSLASFSKYYHHTWPAYVCCCDLCVCAKSASLRSMFSMSVVHVLWCVLCVHSAHTIFLTLLAFKANFHARLGLPVIEGAHRGSTHTQANLC